MNSDKTPKKPGAALRLITAAALVLGALCAPQAQAQVPGRFYWHTLSDSNAVPLIFQSISEIGRASCRERVFSSV